MFSLFFLSYLLLLFFLSWRVSLSEFYPLLFVLHIPYRTLGFGRGNGNRGVSPARKNWHYGKAAIGVCGAGMAVRFWCVSGFLGYFVVGRRYTGGKGRYWRKTNRGEAYLVDGQFAEQISIMNPRAMLE